MDDLDLGGWIRKKWGTQSAFAKKVGVQQGRVSAWVAATNEISEGYREKIRSLGYKGPWPEKAREEAQEAPAAGISPEEHWKLVGRVEALEKTVGEYREALWYLKKRLKEDLRLDLEKEP